MSAHQSEAADNLLLEKARQAIAYAKQKEDEARAELAAAAATTKRLREKFEELHGECEKRAVARRKAGLIESSSQY